MNIQVTYTAKWRLKSNSKYVWTNCKKLINTNTGREIKKTLKGLTPGYWIGKKFISLEKMKLDIEIIKKVKPPF